MPATFVTAAPLSKARAEIMVQSDTLAEAAAARPTIVFDLDGTLADTNRDLLPVLNRTIAAAGLDPVSKQDIGHMFGSGARAMIARAFEVHQAALAQTELDRMFDAFLEDYAENLCVETVLFPGAAEAVDRFRTAGWLTAVCTNKMERFARPLLEGLGMIDRFNALSGGDTLPVRKPDPLHLTETIRMAGGHPANAILIGDSITEAWDKSGQKVWEKKLLPLNAANFGIGGDTTQNVLWRITEGKALEKVRPKVVVLMIGTNNFGLHNDTPEAVVRGVAAVVKTVRKKLPDAHLLLLGIFPRSEHPGDKLRREVAAANEKIAGIGAGDDHIHFLRIWDEFLEQDGTISTRVMPDRLHLTEHGYNIWADTMMSHLRKYLTK